MPGKTKCILCGSEQISANKRGWNMLTGFIGSGNIVITCLNCGHRWKPQSYESQKTEADLMLITIPCLLIGIFMFNSIKAGLLLTVLSLTFYLVIKKLNG